MNETKYKTTQYIETGVAADMVGYLDHNSINTHALWKQGSASTFKIFPSRGDAQNQMEGKEFYLKGIKLRLQLTFAGDRLRSKVKMWYVPNKNDITPVYANFQQNVTGNVMMDPINLKNFPGTRFLGTIKVPNGTNVQGVTGAVEPFASGTRPVSVMFNKFISFNKYVTYKQNNDDSSIDTQKIPALPEQGWLLFATYDDQGSLETDTCVTNIEGAVTTYFKDP